MEILLERNSFLYPSDELLQKSITICFLNSANSFDEVLLLAFFFLEGFLPLFLTWRPTAHLELLLGQMKPTSEGERWVVYLKKYLRVGKSWLLHSRTIRRGKRGLFFSPP